MSPAIALRDSFARGAGMFVPPQGLVATGGTVYTVEGWKHHVFTASGTFSVSSGAKTLTITALDGGSNGSSGLSGGTGGNYGAAIVKTIAGDAGNYTVTVGGAASASDCTRSGYGTTTVQSVSAGSGTGTATTGNFFALKKALNRDYTGGSGGVGAIIYPFASQRSPSAGNQYGGGSGGSAYFNNISCYQYGYYTANNGNSATANSGGGGGGGSYGTQYSTSYYDYCLGTYTTGYVSERYGYGGSGGSGLVIVSYQV